MYTPEAVEMAKNLQRNPDLQRTLAHLLREIAAPVSYSNKDFDDRQALATVFATLQQTPPVPTPAAAEIAAAVCDSCGLSHSAELDCSAVPDADKEKVLAAAREAQDAFWRALGDLEAVTGVADIDGTQDLRDATLETLAGE